MTCTVNYFLNTHIVQETENLHCLKFLLKSTYTLYIIKVLLMSILYDHYNIYHTFLFLFAFRSQLYGVDYSYPTLSMETSISHIVISSLLKPAIFVSFFIVSISISVFFSFLLLSVYVYLNTIPTEHKYFYKKIEKINLSLLYS